MTSNLNRKSGRASQGLNNSSRKAEQSHPLKFWLMCSGKPLADFVNREWSAEIQDLTNQALSLNPLDPSQQAEFLRIQGKIEVYTRLLDPEYNKVLTTRFAKEDYEEANARMA